MPGNTRPLCQRAEVKQISTGQAGQHVNRDLETLFEAVNGLSKCASRIAAFLDSLTQGAFGPGNEATTGGGSTGSGPDSNPDTGLGTLQMLSVESATDWDLPTAFSGVVLVSPSADIDLTLPIPGAGQPIMVVHRGPASVVTVKDDGGAAIGQLTVGGTSLITPWVDDAGDPHWPSALVVIGANGSVILAKALVVTDDSEGIMLTSPNGHLFRLTVNNAGALATADLGAVAPDTSTP